MQSSKITRVWSVLLLMGGMIVPYSASAKPEFLDAFKAQYPAVVGTRLETCNVCHTQIPKRNPYGRDFGLAGQWFPAIEAVDSDGDGPDNLTEITALTFPGDPLDFPGAPPTATATPNATPTHTPVSVGTVEPGSCTGDCNGDGVVAVNELVLAVNIALGTATVEECAAADADGDGEVTVNELVTAVNLALAGC